MPTQLLQLLVLLELFQNPPMTWKTLGMNLGVPRWDAESKFQVVSQQCGGNPVF